MRPRLRAGDSAQGGRAVFFLVADQVSDILTTPVILCWYMVSGPENERLPIQPANHCLATLPLRSSALDHRLTCFLEVVGRKAVDLFFNR